MSIDTVELGRFALEGKLGEGAELQVFAATDTATGRPVVVKRPHPTLVARLQHREVEERLARLAALRVELGDSLPHLSRLLGQASAENHDAYFGDSLGQSYTVMVEERARGLPLVGSVVDGIKGSPIGLPQNLFALHSLVPHSEVGALTIQRDILDVAQAFHDAGLLALDLRPQNVFFDPKAATITVIDVGNVVVERPATRRRGPLDLHDLFLEVFKWYTTAADPPEGPTDYGIPYGMGSVSMFARDLDRMLGEFSAMGSESVKEVAVAILERVRQRGYRSFVEFRRDFTEYLALTEERYADLARSAELMEAWRQALGQLNDPFWRKFLFDPNEDLAAYG